MLAHPIAGRKGAHQLAIEAAGMLVIDILDHAAFLQVSGAEAPRQGAILFPQPLLVHQQGETFFEAELAGFGGFHLRTEGVGESVQFQGVQFFDGLLIQHVGSFLFFLGELCYCTSLLGGS